MNSLESLISEATQAAADEVTTADIPPFRLPQQPRSLRAARPRRVHSSPRHPRAASRWLTPLAAALSLAAVVAFLVVIRYAAGSRPGGALSASTPVSRAQKLLAREAIDAYFPATGAQYTAGLAFAWTRQTILARNAGPCLKQAGFPLTSFPRSRRRYQLSFPDNGQFPDLAQRTRTHSMAPAAGGVRSDRARPWAHGDQRGNAAVATCMAGHARSLWRLDKMARPLAGAWLADVRKIQSSAQVRGMRPGFVSCLESFGVPTRFAGTRRAGGDRLFAGFFAWMARLGANSASPQRYASQQRLWTPVFVTCARPTVTTLERLQRAARSKFLDVHARQIAAISHIVIGLAPAGRAAP